VAKLYWDGSFEIALHLMASHPDVDLDEVTLQQVCDWTLALPEFADDPELVNEELLTAILQEWFEEKNPL
jgi:FeS assembly protein IscX